MASAFNINGGEFKQIFIRAFTSPADKPLTDAGGRLRAGLIPVLGIFLLSAGLWFIMNLSFRNRHSPAPFALTLWVILSLSSCLFFGLALMIRREIRFCALIPFSFALFPLAYLVIALWGGTLRERIPGSAAANGLDWKFIYDCVWISIELVLTFVFLRISRTGNPFALPRPGAKRRPGLPMKKLIRFWELLFIVVVLFLLVIILRQRRFPADRFFPLLKYQIPFAVLMSLKEELFFRWILLRLGERYLKSRFVSVCIAALIWSGYHGFFGGEGIGTGLWPAFWVCVVSFWWSLLSYRYNSIWPAWIGHTAIEFYGFYLMYLSFL
ncbi:MAG: CPBP family intramembrane metalloprotease [Treponema sp.]|nr:CPBP family intramembrane metalloprotease [Treponema sp.]